MTIVAGSLVRTVSDTYSGERKMPMRASPTDAQAAFYVRPGADALVVSGHVGWVYERDIKGAVPDA